MTKPTQPSEQTVRERLVNFGIELLLLDESKKPKNQKDIDEQKLLDVYEAEINQVIVSVLEELQFDLNSMKRVYTDGLNQSSMQMAVPIKDIDAAIAKYKQEKTI